MGMWRTRLNNEQGVAIVLAVMVLLVLTGILMAFLSVSALEPQISRNVADTARARYLAEAGIEIGFNLLVNTGDCTLRVTGVAPVSQLVATVGSKVSLFGRITRTGTRNVLIVVVWVVCATNGFRPTIWIWKVEVPSVTVRLNRFTEVVPVAAGTAPSVWWCGWKSRITCRVPILGSDVPADACAPPAAARAATISIDVPSFARVRIFIALPPRSDRYGRIVSVQILQRHDGRSR